MATTGPRIRYEEEFELLSDLYLTLWKQLDVICPENKWLDVGSADPTELMRQAERNLKALAPQLSACEALPGVISKDFQKTQTFVQGAREVEGTKLEDFKDYLRDLALRYSQASDEK